MVLLLVAGAVLLAGCNSPGGHRALSQPVAGQTSRVFPVVGVIQTLNPDGKTVVIRHEEIPNYMPSMTMPFAAKDTSDLSGLRPGDQVTFRLNVSQDTSWIDRIRKTAGGNALAAASPIRVVREVEPLQIGDLLPDRSGETDSDERCAGKLASVDDLVRSRV